jgi:hypothetical protein
MALEEEGVWRRRKVGKGETICTLAGGRHGVLMITPRIRQAGISTKAGPLLLYKGVEIGSAMGAFSKYESLFFLVPVSVVLALLPLRISLMYSPVPLLILLAILSATMAFVSRVVAEQIMHILLDAALCLSIVHLQILIAPSQSRPYTLLPIFPLSCGEWSCRLPSDGTYLIRG